MNRYESILCDMTHEHQAEVPHRYNDKDKLSRNQKIALRFWKYVIAEEFSEIKQILKCVTMDRRRDFRITGKDH